MGRKKEIIRELRASILLKDSIIVQCRELLHENEDVIQCQSSEINNMRGEIVRLEKENASLIKERDELQNPNKISIVQE